MKKQGAGGLIYISISENIEGKITLDQTTGPLNKFYTQENLQLIISRAAKILTTDIDSSAALEVAKRSRGTPRIANRLLKRVRDWAQVQHLAKITNENISNTLHNLGIDQLGLDDLDRLYLNTIIKKFSGGPVGIETIAASISEQSDTIEDVVEPFLLQLGFIDRTSRGRVVTKNAFLHLGITPPETTQNQIKLF